MKRKFARSLLLDTWDVLGGGAHLDLEEYEDERGRKRFRATSDRKVEILMDEMIDTTRWSSINRLVFRHPDEGTLWEAVYTAGLTEMQMEETWEYETEVEFEQVEAYEKTVTDYKPVEA